MTEEQYPEYEKDFGSPEVGEEVLVVLPEEKPFIGIVQEVSSVRGYGLNNYPGYLPREVICRKLPNALKLVENPHNLKTGDRVWVEMEVDTFFTNEADPRVHVRYPGGTSAFIGVLPMDLYQLAPKHKAQ